MIHPVIKEKIQIYSLQLNRFLLNFSKEYLLKALLHLVFELSGTIVPDNQIEALLIAGIFAKFNY
jgi:hypothetical protein